MAPVGIYRHGAGYRAAVSQGRGRPKLYRQFPLDTSLAVMQEWRKDAQAAARIQRKRRAAKGSFEADADRYLRAVSALTTKKERAQHIALWKTVFAGRQRDSIRPDEIRAQRDRWLTVPRGKDLPPLSANTVNKRLRALSNLYRVLDGKQAYNPVRDVDEAPEPAPIPRAVAYETIERIIGAMKVSRDGQWRRHDPPPGWQPSRPSLAPVRVAILAYTGMSPATLKRLKPSDVDTDRALLTLPARKKGRGVSATIVPLLPPAVAAFRRLQALNGFGSFNLRSVRLAFTDAAKRVGVSGVRLHDLRHSLATIAYDLTHSLDVVMALLQHSSPATTKRYTMAAALRVLQQQMTPMTERFGTTFRDNGLPQPAPKSNNSLQRPVVPSAHSGEGRKARNTRIAQEKVGGR